MRDRHIEVVGPSGARGSVDTAQWPADRPGASVAIEFDDGRVLCVRPGDLRPLPDGRYELVTPPGGGDTGDAPGAGAPAAVIPVIEEHLAVSTRTVDRGGVRVRKTVHEHEETVDPPLMHEDVTVERIAIQREVAGPLPVREEEGQIVVPLVEEVLIVRKAWVLREELRISRRRFTVHRPTTVLLRAEHAEVQRLDPAGTPEAAGGPRGAAGPDTGQTAPGG